MNRRIRMSFWNDMEVHRVFRAYIDLWSLWKDREAWVENELF
jgi:hypothetical protein